MVGISLRSWLYRCTTCTVGPTSDMRFVKLKTYEAELHDGRHLVAQLVVQVHHLHTERVSERLELQSQLNSDTYALVPARVPAMHDQARALMALSCSTSCRSLSEERQVLAWEVHLTEAISAKPAALVYSDTGSSQTCQERQRSDGCLPGRCASHR